MMRCTHIILALLIMFAWRQSQAADRQPILINNSRSPDGHKILQITPPAIDTGFAEGRVAVVDTRRGRPLGHFDWQGFGITPDRDAFTVLWRRDSRAFAINYQITRGFVAYAVYVQTRRGWSMVKMPEIHKEVDAMLKAAGPAGPEVLEHSNGHGQMIAKAWLPGYLLRVKRSTTGIMWPYQGDNAERAEFLFTYVIVTPAHGKPHGVLVRSRLIPRSAYTGS